MIPRISLSGFFIFLDKYLISVFMGSAAYDVNISESFQNDLLKQLTPYSDGYHLKIVDFQEPHIISEKGFTTTSYIFSLEGSFNGCLAVLNKVENNPALGTIRHLNFVKKRNYKTSTDHLFVEVICKKTKMFIKKNIMK